MIQRHHPGGAMMTDYAGYRPRGDDGTGCVAVFELFVAVLPASDYTFACVVRSQKTVDWLDANEHALRFFGGVPETIVSDNLKAAVSRPKGRTGPAVINPAFEAFCDHHGTLAKPAAVYSPTHKAKVEIGVKLVQRLLRLALNDRPRLRVAAMNALLAELVERLNHKPLRRAKGETRHSLYRALDLPALRPLRQDAFAFHEVRRDLMLGADYHLVHDQCRYSAPHTLIGRKLDLRANTNAVEIWHDGRAVALHARLFQPGGLSTDPAHMPPAHLARRAAVEESFLLWAQLQGTGVQAVAQAEADRPFYGAAKAGFDRAFRELHGPVGARRLEAACDRAVRSGRPRRDHVRNILNRGLEFTDPAEFVPPTSLPKPTRTSAARTTSPEPDRMTTTQLIDRMRDLGLDGMAGAVEHHAASTTYADLPFDDRLMHLLHAEGAWRDERRLKRILKAARLKIPAAVEDIEYRPARGLDRSQVAEPMTCAWVSAHEHLILTGATGTGKTHLACAFGGQTARHGLTVRYARTNQLLEDLAIAHQDGTVIKARTALARFDLLILDDFGLAPMTERGKQDLLDIIDARTRTSSILLAGQLPFKEWHAYIDNQMVADAILDRVANASHRIQLSGESMRRMTVARK